MEGKQVNKKKREEELRELREVKTKKDRLA